MLSTPPPDDDHEADRPSRNYAPVAVAVHRPARGREEYDDDDDDDGDTDMASASPSHPFNHPLQAMARRAHQRSFTTWLGRMLAKNEARNGLLAVIAILLLLILLVQLSPASVSVIRPPSGFPSAALVQESESNSPPSSPALPSSPSPPLPLPLPPTTSTPTSTLMSNGSVSPGQLASASASASASGCSLLVVSRESTCVCPPLLVPPELEACGEYRMGRSPPAWGCYAQWYRMAARIARPKPLRCPHIDKQQILTTPTPTEVEAASGPTAARARHSSSSSSSPATSALVTSLYKQSLSSMLAEIDSMTGLELMSSSAMEYITGQALPSWAPSHSTHHQGPSADGDGDGRHPPLTIQHLSSSSPLIGREEPPYYNSPPPEGVWTKETRDKWEARSRWAHAYFRDTVIKVSDKVRRMMGENVGDVVNEDGSAASSSSSSSSDPSRPSSIFDIQTMVVSGGPNLRGRMDLVMASWAEQFPATRFTIISDSPDDKGVLPVTVIPGTAGYHNSQRKWLAGLKELWKDGALYRDDAPHFFMIADDDGYVHVSNLMQLVNELDYRMPMLIGEVCPYGPKTTPEKVQLQRLCGGGGWLMSLAAAKLIEPYVDECQQYNSKHAPGSHQWSDTFIGACLKERLGSKLMFFDSPHFISIGPTEMMSPPYDSPRLPGAFKRPSASSPNSALPSNFWRLVTHHYVKPWQSVLGLWRMENAWVERTNPKHLERIKRILDFIEETNKAED